MGFKSISFFFCLTCAFVPISLILSLGDTNEGQDWTYHHRTESTSSPPRELLSGCHFEGKTYQNGQRMAVTNPCIHCFCVGAKAQCFMQNCPPPPIGCQLLPSANSCPSSAYNCSIPDQLQTPLLLGRDSKIYGQRARGSGLVRADCLIRGIAYLVGETVGVASSTCLQCRCAKQSLLCLPLCCYEPVLTAARQRESRRQLEHSFHRAVHQRDPHPLEHLL